MMSLVDTATATEAHPLPQSWRPWQFFIYTLTFVI
jgi:hypothetical protein